MDPNDELAWLQRDKEENPGCSYSSNSTKTCTSTNGKFVCETIKHFTRHCPGKRPVDVFYSKSTDDNVPTHDHDGGIDIIGGFGDNFGLFGDILKHLPNMFPGISFEDGIEAPHSIPPHKGKTPEINIKGRVSGPIEKI